MANMADAFAFSPRRQPSAQGRTPRSPLPPPAACVDVQWTFLPPQPLPKSPHRQAQPFRPVDSYDNASAREEILMEQARLRAAKDAADAREQRVLYDLMGETQRQAMLDKVMAEMEAMALTPVRRLASPRHGRHHEQATSIQPMIPPGTRRSSVLPTNGSQERNVELLPQRRLSALGTGAPHSLVGPAASDDSDRDSDSEKSDDNDSDTFDSDDEDDRGRRSQADDIPELRAIRDRQRRRTERKSVELSSRPDEIHIRWQKSAHVCVAMDLPVVLLDDEDDDDGQQALMGQDLVEDLFPLSEETVREAQRRRSTRPNRTRKNKGNATSSPTRPEESQNASLVLGVPKSPRGIKASYGSWYLPREEWWPLHQTQQETLAELYPNDVPPPVERHRCERKSPNQRRQPHKDALARLQQEPTHPHAWPNLLRSPSASPRVVPLMRAAPTVSAARRAAAPPATSHAIRSPRSSLVTVATTPPASSSSASRGGTVQPDRIATATTIAGPISPRGSLAPVSATNAPPDPIAQRAAALQQEIPQAYIAREYRNYLAAKGARVPAFLNY